MTHPTDNHVGNRVRLRRMMLSMSQEKLGDALGLSFQQVQKYEKGVNRISASRLQEMADVLQVPVTFFFEDLPVHTNEKSSLMSSFLASPDVLALSKAFMRIKDQKLRRRIVYLVERIADEKGFST